MPDRIDYEDGSIDDVFVEDVEMFRLEKMNDGCFWIKCYRKDKSKPDIVIWLNSTAKITGKHEED